MLLRKGNLQVESLVMEIIIGESRKLLSTIGVESPLLNQDPRKPKRKASLIIGLTDIAPV